MSLVNAKFLIIAIIVVFPASCKQRLESGSSVAFAQESYNAFEKWVIEKSSKANLDAIYENPIGSALKKFKEFNYNVRVNNIRGSLGVFTFHIPNEDGFRSKFKLSVQVWSGGGYKNRKL